jgi:hypothetical protein
MTPVEKLLSISSEPLAPRPKAPAKILESYPIGPELFHMLECKNGFYAFESALHVFPLTSAVGMSLEEWNADSLWRNGYEDLAEGLLFFAEDIVQNQFCLSADGVLCFFSETGETAVMSDSIRRMGGKHIGRLRVQNLMAAGSQMASREWASSDRKEAYAESSVLPRWRIFDRESLGGRSGRGNAFKGRPCPSNEKIAGWISR